MGEEAQLNEEDVQRLTAQLKGEKEEAVTVSIRIRNLSHDKSSFEYEENATKWVKVNGPKVLIWEDEAQPPQYVDRGYAFNECFDSSEAGGGPHTQEYVYRSLTRRLNEAVEDSRNFCLFCYGQTGSGKTYTMLGPKEWPTEEAQWGIVPRVIRQLMELKAFKESTHDITVTLRIFEIYCEQVRNLLVPKSKWPPHGLQLVDAHERGFEIYDPKHSDAVERPLRDVDTAIQLIVEAWAARAVGSHKQNLESSRAHTVYEVNFRQCPKAAGSEAVVESQIMLVDLAGSEKSDKAGTYANKQLLAEGNAINLSLSELRKVIDTMASGHEVTRWRTSALVKMLKRALSNGVVNVIGNLSPARKCVEESVNTLRFMKSCKEVKVRTVRNAETDEAALKAAYYNEKLREMREKVEAAMKGGGGGGGGGGAARAMTEEEEREYEELKKNAEVEQKALAKRQWELAEQLRQREREAERQEAEFRATLGGLKVFSTRRPTGPALLNLDPDPRLSETLVYPLACPGETLVGSGDGAAEGVIVDVQLRAGGDWTLLPVHCKITLVRGSAVGSANTRKVQAFVTPMSSRGGEPARVFVNGRAVAEKTEITHNTRLWLAADTAMRVWLPDAVQVAGADKVTPAMLEDESITFTKAREEVQRAADDYAADVPLTDAQRAELSELIRQVDWANRLAAQLRRNVVYEPRLYPSRVDGRAAPHVQVAYPQLGVTLVLSADVWDDVQAGLQLQMQQYEYCKQQGTPFAPPLVEKDPFYVQPRFMIGDAAIITRPVLFRVKHSARGLILGLNEEIYGYVEVDFSPVDTHGGKGPWRGSAAERDPFCRDPRVLIGGAPFDVDITLRGIIFAKIKPEDVGKGGGLSAPPTLAGQTSAASPTSTAQGGGDAVAVAGDRGEKEKDKDLCVYTDTSLAFRWPFGGVVRAMKGEEGKGGGLVPMSPGGWSMARGSAASLVAGSTGGGGGGGWAAASNAGGGSGGGGEEGRWYTTPVCTKNTSTPRFEFTKRVTIQIQDDEQHDAIRDGHMLVQVWGKVDFVACQVSSKTKELAAVETREEITLLDQRISATKAKPFFLLSLSCDSPLCTFVSSARVFFTAVSLEDEISQLQAQLAAAGVSPDSAPAVEVGG